MLDPNKVALRLFSWRIERASPPSLWPPAGGILADFWGVGSLEKRERRLEGKMQTVNSKKKKQKEMPMPISPQMVIFKHVAKGRQGFPRSKGDPRDG